jgi:hypothetical protein
LPYLLDQVTERRDAGGGLTAAEPPGVVHIPGHQVGQRAAALVLVLDPPQRGQLTGDRLDLSEDRRGKS